MEIKIYDTEKEFKEAIDDYLLLGFSIKNEEPNKVTMKKMKASKIFIHIIIIFFGWLFGSFFFIRFSIV